MKPDSPTDPDDALAGGPTDEPTVVDTGATAAPRRRRWSRLLPSGSLPQLSIPAIPVRPLAIDELEPAPPADESAQEVPHGLKLAADLTWRVLVVCAGLYLVWRILGDLSEVVIPLVVALLFTAALWPVKSLLVRLHLPRWLAVTLCLLLLVGLVLGIFALVGTQVASQSNSLMDAAVASYQQLMNWLGDGPLKLQQAQIDGWTKQATEWAKTQQSAVADYATTFGAQVGHFFAGLLLALFTLFFFLYEGDRMSRGLLAVVPRASRGRVRHASRQGWTALVSYVRAAIVVAAVDGLGAGIGAAAVGSDLFLAIGSLTFLTAFIPLLGAFISGLVATSVVLLTLGWVKAVIMLVVFVAVMEVEAHVLQPFLLGKAVSIHPLAVLYGIAIGTILGGIVGALFAMPLMAFGNAFARSLAGARRERAVGSDDQLPVDDGDEAPALP